MFERLKASSKSSQTRPPRQLDPGRGRTKIGELFAYAGDERPGGGAETRLPQCGFVRQEDISLNDVLANRFGCIYDRENISNRWQKAA